MSQTSPDTPVADAIAKHDFGFCGRCRLDWDRLMLVRLAALVAADGPPASYLTNIGLAVDPGITARRVQDVLVAMAPIVGTARVVSAAGNIAKALGIAIAVAEEATG